jgi:hypothetical protein
MVGQIVTVRISNPGDVVHAILLTRGHLPYFVKVLMQFHILWMRTGLCVTGDGVLRVAAE